MANTRTRTFDQRAGLVGTYITFPPFPSVTVQSALAGPSGTCTDTVGNRKSSNAFNCVRKETWLPTYSGIYPKSGTPTKQLINCPSDYHPSEPVPSSKFADLTTLDLSNLAWSSLAATNPNVPQFSVPTFIAELKDIPGLVKDWGGSLLRKVAKGHLTWRWALKPMISDITKMVNFVSAVNQRIAWLTRMRDGDGKLKRRANIRSNSNQDTPTTVQLKSVGAFIQGRRTCIYTEKVWCTVQWKLAPGARIPNPSAELEFLARRLVLGITTHEALATLWEILPWSWFADWFLGVGTVISATNNTVPLVWGDVCLMRTRTARANIQEIPSADTAWCHSSGVHRQSQVIKERFLPSIVLPFTPSVLPILDLGKWSILASLAVLKR